jgi:hypothetical protein
MPHTTIYYTNNRYSPRSTARQQDAMAGKKIRIIFSSRENTKNGIPNATRNKQQPAMNIISAFSIHVHSLILAECMALLSGVREVS